MIGWLLACGPATEPTDSDPPVQAAGLEQYGLLDWDGSAFTYSEDVVPYDLATPLFSDHAVKLRAIRLPSPAAYAPDQILDLPVGTVLLKSFLFPADLRRPEDDLRLIETRVLERKPDGWDREPWIWEGDGATHAPGGAALQIEVIGLDGQPLSIPYLVPQRNQCIDCHERTIDDESQLVPIGPQARHLNRVFDAGAGALNQLEHLAAEGLLTGLPAIETVPAATRYDLLRGVDLDTLSTEEITTAARDYLDINCAHCHNPRGVEGVSSQLFLQHDATDAFDLGVCKRPGSAGLGNGGLTYDIVPGDHTQSILWFRMNTEQVGAMMPDIGRALRDDLGVELVARWIDSLEGSCD